jgi:hypothetical protein
MNLHNEELDVLFLHTGGLGDLVLASEWIASARAANPTWRITLGCWSEFASIVELLPAPPHTVIGFDINPCLWGEPRDDLFACLDSIVEQFHDRRVDLLVDGSLRPTWFMWFLAALKKPHWSVCCASSREPGEMLRAVLDRFGLSREAVHHIDLPQQIHEREFVWCGSDQHGSTRPKQSELLERTSAVSKPSLGVPTPTRQVR